MNRHVAVLTSLLAVLAFSAAPAQAASKSCTRDGAKLLAATGTTRVVSLKEKAVNSETRRDRVLACWTPTGKRFTLFHSRDFGLDSIERDHYEIVDGRYVGVIRHFEGGVTESRTAAIWDAQRRKLLHDTKACDETTTGDFYGVEDAVFFNGGGIAYSCLGGLRIADTKGDRQLEPAGAKVTQLAVSSNMHSYSERLYWTADTTLKTLSLSQF